MGQIGVWESVEDGVIRNILTSGEDLMIMEVHFTNGAIGKKHQHPHEQISYCLDGKFKFTIGTAHKIIEKGESLYIPPNTLHGVKALSDGSLLDSFSPVREDLLEGKHS